VDKVSKPPEIKGSLLGKRKDRENLHHFTKKEEDRQDLSSDSQREINSSEDK